MPTSLFIFLLIYFWIKNHRANGLTLWLLIASGVPMFLFSTSTLVVFVYTRKLILAQSNEEITPAFNQYRLAIRVLWWLTILGESCYNTIHWISAMKYWTLAYKLKLIKEKQDPDQHNNKFMLIFVVGIIFNLLSAIFNQCALSYKLNDKVVPLTYTALFFTLPLFISWLLLSDAFRRFRNEKSSI